MGRNFVACKHLVILLMAVLMLSMEASAASNQALVYQGRIIRPDGTVPNTGAITFTLAVYSPNPSKCLLYSENQTVDMSGSQGMFSLAVGSGTRTDGGVHSFSKIFVNGGTISGLTCGNGATAFSPGSSDDRNLVVSFNDKGAVVTLSALDIKSVPFALQAAEIGGYGVNDIVKIHPTTGSPTTFTTAEMTKIRGIGAAACANNEILKWNGTAWACAPDATGAAPGDAGYGTSKGVVSFDTNAATSGITVASGVAKLSDVNSNIGSFGGAAKAISFTVNAQGRVTAASEMDISLPVGQLTQSGASSGQVLKWNGSAWAPAADLGVTSDASYAAKGVVQFDTDAVTSGISIASGVAKVNTGVGANQIVKLDGTGKLPAVDGSALTNITATGYSGVLPIANGGTNSSTALTNDRLMVSSGGKIVEAPAMTNGQLLIGSTGGAPEVATLGSSNGISLTTGAGSLSIATNATPNNTASTIVSRDASGNFAAGAVSFSSTVLRGSSSGNLTMRASPSVTDYTVTWPAAVGSAGQFLTTDASGNLSWGSPAAIADASYAGKGAVQFLTDASTSGISISSGVASVNAGTGANQIVKLNSSSQLPSVDGSLLTNLSAANIASGVLPIARGGTNNGSLGVTAGGILYMDGSKAMTTAAGTSGQVLLSTGAGAPAFGNLSIGAGGTGATSFTANSLIMANGTGSALTSMTCAPGQILKWNAGGTAWECAADATGTSPGDASFAAKGLVQGLTDAATSGLNISSGVLSVNAGTGANQIMKLNGSSQLPAVDGSLLTNLSAANISSGVLPIARGGTNSGTALNNDRLMLSSGGAIVEAPAMTNGQIVVGSTGAAPAVATLGSSNGISITTGAGSLSIATNATSANTASTIVSRDASGNFSAGAGSFSSTLLRGSTSGTLTVSAPATVTDYTIRFPGAVGTAGQFLTTDASGNLSWGSPAAISDSSYSVKGAVQFLTDAPTSGIDIASGVAKVNTGTGANQIVKLNGSSQLPALDGSLLTNLSAAQITAGTLPIARGGTAATSFAANSLIMANGTGSAFTSMTCSLGEILKWNGTAWACSTGAGAVADAGYTSSNKGVVAFDTDAATSGVSVTSGVAKVNAGTSANQIVKLDGSAKLPAVDGSALTNVTASAYNGVLPIANGGTNSSTALSNDRLMVSSGGKIVEAPAMTNGQIVVGSTGAAPAVATLGSSNGISITTGAGSLSIATNATSANTASTIVSRDASGNFAAGAGSFSSTLLRGSSSGTLTVSVPATVTDYTIRFPGAVGSAGQFLTTDASGNLSWGSPAAISDSSYSVKGAVQFLTDAPTSGIDIASGVAKVNTGTGANQIVKLNGSSQLPALDGSLLTNLSAGNIASGVLPIARGGTNNGSLGTTNGGVVYADGSKLMTSAAGTTGQALISNGAAAPTFGTLGFAGGGTGSTSFTAHGLVIANAGGTALTSKICTNNEILKWDGTTWACAADATGSSPGDATYAAKGLVQGLTNAATSGLNISSGVISVNSGTATNQIVKLDGSAKLPAVDGSALTNLTAGNLTGTVPVANGGTGLSSYTAGDMLYATSATAVSKLAIGANGSIMTSNGSAPVWSSLSSLGFFLDGGNTVTGIATLGTNSNHNLEFETNGTTKMAILADGKVGIGVASPTSFFEVNAGVSTVNATGLGILLQGQAASTLGFNHGGAVTLRGGKGYGNDGAGAEVIAGGGTDVQGGGSVTLKAGNGNSNASPGHIYIEAGSTANNGGGHVNITSGTGGSNKSGNIYVAAGSGGTLGDILLGINSSGNVRGNVGIGVTSAGSAFDLNGAFTQRGMAAPAVSSAGQGRIYFDSTANKFKISQNGGAFVDLVQASASDASYSAKGLVQGLTDAATSGLNISSGVISVNSGTAANQVLKLNGSAQLPAVDGSLLTNLSASNISTGTLPVARGGTNATSFAANRLVGTNGTGAALQAVTCSQNQVISFDASGNYGCYNVNSIFSGFVNGGNSFGANAVVGTNDNKDLIFETWDTPRMAIDYIGNVGIGTADPSFPFHVVGETRFDGQVAIESETASQPSRLLISHTNVQNEGPPALYFAAQDNYSHPIATEELGVISFINGFNWNLGAKIKAEAAENFTSTAAGTSLKFYTTAKGTLDNQERLIIDSEGVITIGSQIDRTVAYDRGQLAFETTYLQTANANTSINWNLGNVQELSTFVCNGSKTITMTNLKDGGSYSLLISGAGAHSGTCLFAAAGKTFKTAGGATAPTASRDILFSFQVINNTVVYSMSDNLQ